MVLLLFSPFPRSEPATGFSLAAFSKFDPDGAPSTITPGCGCKSVPHRLKCRMPCFSTVPGCS